MDRVYIVALPIVNEWSDRNKISPDGITAGSHKKVWWKGSCGHEWEAIVKNRLNGSGCPYCSGNRILAGFNDLATKAPELASEWSESNEPLLPTEVAVQSNKSVWWIGKCGHEWKARIADRTQGHGCPYCAGKILPGFNDLVTTNPELMVEWSERNEVDPTQYSKHSMVSVWWKCKACGNEWKAVIATKVKGTECPFCRHELSKQHYQKMLEDRKQRRYLKRYKGALLLESWLIKYKVTFLKNDDTEVGLPFQFYLPNYHVVIEFTNGYVSDAQRKYEYIKNDLCLKSRIHMIRILGVGVKEFNNCLCISLCDDSDVAITESLNVIFDKLGLQQ